MFKINRLSYIAIVILFIALFTQLYIGIVDFERNSNMERMEVIESAIQKAAVQCYAIEGSYPPNLEYLVENYGLIVNEDKFIYHYEAMTANILPKIAVYKKW